MSSWQRNGGGDIWVVLCSQRGGTPEFFHYAGQNAKKLQKIGEKISCSPPPGCERSNTQKSPPRCVPSKTPDTLLLFITSITAV